MVMDETDVGDASPWGYKKIAMAGGDALKKTS
jgi:hypothetical protein